MRAKTFSIVNRVDVRPPAQSLRHAAVKHCKAVNEIGGTKGVFISEGATGILQYDIWGCSGSDAVAMLEEAKYCVIRSMYK